jgi:hypothetical protein
MKPTSHAPVNECCMAGCSDDATTALILGKKA